MQMVIKFSLCVSKNTIVLTSNVGLLYEPKNYLEKCFEILTKKAEMKFSKEL